MFLTAEFHFKKKRPMLKNSNSEISNLKIDKNIYCRLKLVQKIMRNVKTLAKKQDWMLIT